MAHLNWIFPDLAAVNNKDEEREKEEEEAEDNLFSTIIIFIFCGTEAAN
jgi:hypothetical protein